MENIQYYEALIQKFFSDETTLEEDEKIEDFIEKGEKEKNIFKKYAKTHKYSVDTLHFGTERAYGNPKSDRFAWYAAAALIIFASLSFFLRNNLLKAKEANFATLIVDNNFTVKINPEKNQLIRNQFNKVIGRLENGKLYFPKAESDNQIRLLLDAGKKMKIVLDDNTEISLNSASEISFPNTFKNKVERIVTLNGEAFFSVAKNPMKPFYVKTKLFTTRVLGTKFNIDSYSGDSKNSVYLVEGSIAVDRRQDKRLPSQKEIILKPGEGLGVQSEKTELERIPTDKTADEIAWLKNEIVFDSEPMDEIFSKIERIYDVKINNKNAMLKDKKFSGKFKEDTIDNIMKTIQLSVSCNYTINGKNITITPK